MLRALEPHRHQLTHDGHLQFGLIGGSAGRIEEVFVAPSKHFKVWLNDEPRFRATMQRYRLREADRLAFLAEYPRVSLKQPAFRGAGELRREFERAIAALAE